MTNIPSSETPHAAEAAEAATTSEPSAVTAEPAMATAEPAATTVDSAAASLAAAAKSRLARAIDDARASAEAMSAEAAARVAAAREKAGMTAADWTGQARDKSLDLARQGKDKTSEAIATVGRAISDTAPVIDEKLGAQFGNYARAAAGALESSAEKLAAKDVAELGGDVKHFVQKSPATALGIAAVTGFLLARLFSRSDSRNA